MNKFAIILGEPNSINSEILAKSIAKNYPCVVIGSYTLIKAQLKILKIKFKIKKIELNQNQFKKGLNILDVPLKFKSPFKVNPGESKIYLKKCFDIAHKLSLKRKIKGFINCPIDKKNFLNEKSGGITEYLAKKNDIYQNEVMLIYNKKCSVAPLTTHIKLKNVSKSLKKEIIKKKIITLNNFYFKYFKIKPKIAVLGLNPHNLELKKDSEEVKFIIPAIKKLKRKMNIKGPFPSDTVFLKNNLKKYDIVVGMYHDQVLTPFKTLFGFNAVNITLGLPYLRLSPDHGIAKDKKKLNVSSPLSLNQCIFTLSRL